MPSTLVRRPGESPRAYYFSFADFPEIKDEGETISSATVTSSPDLPSALTLGAASVTGDRVKVSVSGGTAGTTYLLKCLAVTSGGNRMQVAGYLRITEAE